MDTLRKRKDENSKNTETERQRGSDSDFSDIEITQQTGQAKRAKDNWIMTTHIIINIIVTIFVTVVTYIVLDATRSDTTTPHVVYSKSLDTLQSDLEVKIDNLHDGFEQKIKQLGDTEREKYENLNEKLLGKGLKIEHIDKTVSSITTEQQEVKKNLKDLDTVVSGVSDQQDKYSKKLEHISSVVRNEYLEAEKKLQEKFTEASTQIEQTFKKTIEESQSALTSQFENLLRSEIDQKKKEITVLGSKLDTELEKVIVLEKKVHDVDSNVETHRKTITQIIDVLVNKEPLIVVIIILAIVEVMIVAFLCKGLQRNSRDDIDPTERLWNSSSDILNQVRVQPMQSAVCIVSFHRETQSSHKRLTETLMQSDDRLRNVTQLQVMISRHSDIPALPPARLYLFFVDFNERHIILEDPTKGLGDLKLTAVRAAKKIGGDIGVIYVRDGGSRILNDVQLYNPELTSIQRHPELSRLNSRQMVFSIYDRFSQYQLRHLKSVTLRNFNKQY
ncbi:hypothetical protein ScPMuIL_002692 [Solemya velum]